mmetsp:Transcript_102451/g.260167  ORF Transcript_102451/g.260167 Transcript_102451/m.260167 type:complete len:284 (+) Transcript_102451:407-1258(+)
MAILTVHAVVRCSRPASMMALTLQAAERRARCCPRIAMLTVQPALVYHLQRSLHASKRWERLSPWTVMSMTQLTLRCHLQLALRAVRWSRALRCPLRSPGRRRPGPPRTVMSAHRGVAWSKALRCPHQSPGRRRTCLLSTSLSIPCRPSPLSRSRMRRSPARTRKPASRCWPHRRRRPRRRRRRRHQQHRRPRRRRCGCCGSGAPGGGLASGGPWRVSCGSGRRRPARRRCPTRAHPLMRKLISWRRSLPKRGPPGKDGRRLPASTWPRCPRRAEAFVKWRLA